MHAALARTEHRPWPLPTGRWGWRQSWRDLLFAHWPVPAVALRPLVPDGLTIQSFEGTSWVGVVPFRMTGVMLRGLPDIPGLSAFPELNVRLYVERDGKPGVWFLSLDATRRLPVWAGRRLFHLPYERARIAIEPDSDGFAYRCARRRGSEARFEGRYGPTGAVFTARPGTLEHFLTERYCLYAATRDGALTRTEVHHVPWPLQPAAATIAVNTMGAPHGLELAGAPAHLLFARRVDVVGWNPVRV